MLPKLYMLPKFSPFFSPFQKNANINNFNYIHIYLKKRFKKLQKVLDGEDIDLGQDCEGGGGVTIQNCRGRARGMMGGKTGGL